MTADNFKNVRKRSDKKFFAFQLSIDTDNEGQKKLLTAHIGGTYVEPFCGGCAALMYSLNCEVTRIV